MKRVPILLLPLLFVSSLSAQQKFTEFQAGVLFPEDAKTGFIGALSFGRMIDENIGWGIEANLYTKTYTKETKVPQETQGQVEPTLVLREIENSTTMIPLFFKIVFLSQIAPSLDLRVSAGLGYELMWNSEVNYLLDKDDTRFYSGFAWQVGGGVSLPISRAADFFGEVSYHGGTPSRSEPETALGLPVWTEVDMSGFMVRAGLRLYTFGI